MKFLTPLADSLHNSIERYPEALKYLSSRGVTAEDVKRYKIGYSRVVKIYDDGSEDYKNFVSESHKGRDFENSLVFPIMNVFGQVVGLISRRIEEKVYKQFLSEEAKTLGCLFGLFQALPSIYQTGTVYTMEGVFDSIPFSSVFPNTVACLTSDISEAQYQMLSFFCDRIVTIFDNDKAGRMGTIKAAKNFLDTTKVGMPNISSLNLGFKDPSSCLKYMPIEKFREYVRGKVNPFLEAMA